MNVNVAAVVSVVAYLLLAPLFGGLLAGADRRITARMQGRVGPPLLQPFYDVLKLREKEDITVNRVQDAYVACCLVFMVITGALFFAEGFGSTGFNYKHSAWTGTYVLFGLLMVPALLTTLFMREPPVPLRTQLSAGRYSFGHQLA